MIIGLISLTLSNSDNNYDNNTHRIDLDLQEDEPRLNRHTAMTIIKRHEKLRTCRLLALALRERRLHYGVTIAPIVIGALGGGIKQALCDVEREFSECPAKERITKVTVAEMQKTALMDSEAMVRRVFCDFYEPMV